MDRPISLDILNHPLFATAPYPLWVYDPLTLRVLAVNQACCEHYGCPADEALRLKVADLAAEEDRAEFLGWVGTEAASDDLFWGPRRVRHQRRDGTVFPAQVVCVGIQWNGEVARLMLVIDVSAEVSAAETAARHVQYLDALRAISAELASERDVTVLLQRVVERAAALLQADHGAVWLWDEATGLLHPRAWVGFDDWIQTLAERPGDGMAGLIAIERKGQLIANYPAHPAACPELLRRVPIRTAVGQPLMSQGRFLGAIVLGRSGARPTFVESDLAMLDLFAAAAACAIEKATVHGWVVARGVALEGLLRAAATVLQGRLNLPETLGRVVAEAAKVSAAELVRILLVDRAAETLHTAAQHGWPADAVPDVPLASLSGVTLQTGEVISTANAPADPRNPTPDYARAIGVLTHLSVPIHDGERVIGCLTINSRESRDFPRETLECVRGFAQFSGIAISLARQFEREQARRDHLEALQAVIQDLGRHVDIPRMMESVIDRVLRVARADVGAIFTWDVPAGALVPRAWRGTGAWDWMATHPLKSGEGVAGKVAESAQGIIVNDFRSSPLALPTELAETRIEAILAEPLVYRDRLLGVLVIGREECGKPFRDREQDTVRLFATQIGLALEKGRLVEELEAELHDRQEAEAKLLRRNRQVEAVREIGDEVGREIDTNALIDLLAARVMALLDAGGSALYVWEEEEQTLVARAAQGLLRYALLDRRRIGDGLVGAVGEQRQGLVANDYPRSQYVPPTVLESACVEAAMAEPLLFRERLLGVVQVVRDADSDPFDEEDRYTLRLFAKQAALALEHSRLWTELNESFGRLQVLQEDVLRVDKLQTLGQLTSGIVFNLNNTLATIIGQVEQLGVKVQDPRLQESLAIMAEAAQNGVSVVRRLEGFATDKPGGGLVSCDIASIVMESAGITQPRWKDEAELEGRCIQVDVQIPEVPAVLARPGDLREIFAKLILRCLDSMPNGGTITISAQFEPSFGDDPSGSVVVTVRDTGFGMPEYVREHLFDLIVMDPSLRSRQISLGTVREMIDAMGGRIGVTSVPGEGTTFTLRFKATETTLALKVTTAPVPPVTGRRILLVDDNIGLLKTLQVMLEDAGQIVRTADSGRKALRMLDANPVDLVITDLGMPQMNGWELAEAIKAKAPWTPVAILTGWGEQGVRAETRRQVFVDRCLFKPIQLSVLMETIATLTEPAHTRA